MVDSTVAGPWPGACLAPGCRRAAATRGYCARHYQQVRRHGRLTPEREHRRRGAQCLAAGCQAPQAARGYCYRHYQQLRRHGRLTPERQRESRQATCRAPGCTERHSARGYCRRHYMSEYYVPMAARQELAVRRRA